MDSGTEVSRFLDELNLKVMESVYNLVQDEHRGLISRGAVKQGVRAVFEAFSGFMSPKTYEAISVVAEEYRDAVTYTIKETPAGKVVVHACGSGRWFALGRKEPLTVPQYNDVEREPDEAIRFKLQGAK